MTTGRRWVDQKPSVDLPTLVGMVRDDLRTGHFDKEAWDHNHPNRTGRSNKVVMIWAHRALGRGPADPAPTMNEAWDVVLGLAVGR